MSVAFHSDTFTTTGEQRLVSPQYYKPTNRVAISIIRLARLFVGRGGGGAVQHILIAKFQCRVKPTDTRLTIYSLLASFVASQQQADTNH